MPKKIFYFVLSLGILGLISWGVWSSGLDRPSNSTSNQPAPETSSLPFEYQLPVGWEAEQTKIEINTISGGGPMEVLFLKSPNRDLANPSFSDPFVQFEWFQFNPDAKLEDIIPLIALASETLPAQEKFKFGKQDALRFAIQLSKNAQSDGETPAFETEYYLTRLPDQRILKIQIIYNAETSKFKFTKDIVDLLDSVQIK